MPKQPATVAFFGCSHRTLAISPAARHGVDRSPQLRPHVCPAISLWTAQGGEGPSAGSRGGQRPQLGDSRCRSLGGCCVPSAPAAPPHRSRKMGAPCLSLADPDTSHHGPLGLSKVSGLLSLLQPGRGLGEASLFLVCHLVDVIYWSPATEAGPPRLICVCQ